MGSFGCALPHGVGELDYTDGPALEGTQLGPAVFIDPIVLSMQMGACGCLSHSGSRCKQAVAEVFACGMLRFLS